MPTYKAPTKDMMYVLRDVLGVEKYSNLPGFEDVSYDLVSAIIEEGAKICEEVLQPLNQVGDREGCTRNEDGSVTTPTGFKAAYDTYREGGWTGLTAPVEFGGQGLPYVIGITMTEMIDSANHSFGMYPGLTSGAYTAIAVDGSDEQKQTYLPKMIAGEWAGTMNLTEPHCGTDLGQLRTKAEPQDDGTYKITGTKIFISAGEHDLTDNIIHMVLARLPDAPAGVKGISLFIVPKFLVNEDGSLGARNGVTCGSLEEKMGIHGNSTAVLNYDDATGYLIGEANKGLKSMFLMVNAARVGVGVQGLAHSEVSYQNAAEYARDRLQGRSISGAKNPDGPADPIIVHPDVRRMLMDSRAFNEGGRAFAYWLGLNVDISRRSPDEEEREYANDILGLLTPVHKAFLTEMGHRNTIYNQQVFGGHGYIQEWGMEQFVRDSRIAMMYEGANGVQALDLVGRKLPSHGGRAIRRYFEMLGHFLEENNDEKYKEFTDPLAKAIGDMQTATGWLAANGMENPDEAGAASMSYLMMTGYVGFAHMWTKMAVTSLKALEGGTDDPDFHNNKLITARYFMARMLPETEMHLGKMQAGADVMMALPAEAF